MKFALEVSPLTMIGQDNVVIASATNRFIPESGKLWPRKVIEDTVDKAAKVTSQFRILDIPDFSDFS